jgi:tetratricopeptide (TPR) repeat protein
MFGFDRMRNYDRTRILEAAAKARAGKKRERAIGLYRRVLAVERSNADIHARLAPLLAETGQGFDAWMSFQVVARHCLRERSIDRALSVYREATHYLPREVAVWETLARLQHKAGKQREAVESLLEGATQFRSRFHWPQAIHLLRRANQIWPWDYETVYGLARLLAKSDQLEEARRLLEGLEVRSEGDRLRQVYAALFRLDGDLGYAWSWIRSMLRTDAAKSYG